MHKNPSAAVLIIGNEILSGRTLDTNTQNIVLALSKSGIIVHETRTIPDNKKKIIDSVLALSAVHDYVFTTGGIGPTHDDVTSISISEAFGVPCIRNEMIFKLLHEYSKESGQQMNKAREKMAFIPEGSTLISNTISKVPGFSINNVYCLAGVPEIMNSMLNSIIPLLNKGLVVKSLSHTIMTGESNIAEQFEIIQNKYPSVDMGSYPFRKEGMHGTSLVLRSTNYLDLDEAYKDLLRLF